MFIQIIQGPLCDPGRFNAEANRWPTDLKPGAAGYQGCTWGIGADGTGFLSARFDSEASAAVNSKRPEQGDWWDAMEPAFERVSFIDCDDVDTILGGGSDHALFVQVIQGRVKDQDAARAMLREAQGPLAEARPDILGGTMAWHGADGEFTQIMYFTSEEAARSGEVSPTEEAVDAQYRDMMAGEPTFIDLPNPRFD